MTLKELKATEWAKEFKKESPACYQEALEYAMTSDLKVNVYQELVFIGNETETSLNWVISVVDDPTDFWMDAKKTKKEALALCKLMSWKVVKS